MNSTNLKARCGDQRALKIAATLSGRFAWSPVHSHVRSHAFTPRVCCLPMTGDSIKSACPRQLTQAGRSQLPPEQRSAACRASVADDAMKVFGDSLTGFSELSNVQPQPSGWAGLASVTGTRREGTGIESKKTKGPPFIGSPSPSFFTRQVVPTEQFFLN